MDTKILEYRILSLMRHRDAFLKYSPIIKEPLFESDKAKVLLRLITFYHKQKNAKPRAPISSLFALVNSRFKSNETKEYIKIIGLIKKHPLSDDAVSDGIVKRFAKRQMIRMVVLDAVNSIDKESDIDIDKIRTKLDEALAVDTLDILDEASDYMHNPSQRLREEAEQPRIATMFSELDQSLHGGMPAGKIGIVVGPTTVGKTMVLINIAHNAMKQGKKVVYVTLELNGREIAGRFDQLVTRKTYEQLRERPALVYKAIKRLADLGGGMRIRDASAIRLSPSDLSVYLERLRKNFEFDMVLVDQVDLMHSPKEYRERRFELSSIVVSLRRTANSLGIPIWTASQANRGAGKSGNTSMWDIAEDIGKANWADLIVTLSQDEDDKEENVLYMKVEKNRIGPGNPRPILTTDYPIMEVKDSDIVKIDNPKKRKKKNVNGKHEATKKSS